MVPPITTRRQPAIQMKCTPYVRTTPVARFTDDIDYLGAPRRGDREPPFHDGDYAFLLGSGIDGAAIARAEDFARQLNVGAHEILLSGGAIGSQSYVAAVAAHLGVPALWPGQPPLGPTAIVDGTANGPRILRALVRDHQARGRKVALATPDVIDSLEAEEVRGARLKQAVGGLRRLDPDLSAAGPIRLWQLATVLGIIGLIIGGIAVAPSATRAVLMACVGVPFLLVVLFRVVVLLTVIARGPGGASQHARRIDEGDLPAYSVMVPMFRESAVLPDLVEALSRLDYPAAKLDCMLVLESSDRETIAVVRSMMLPPFMRIVVVPDCLPRTKPKALNYALQLARGDYIAVFDAEDVPDPQQLRKAVQAFAEGGPEVVCVQANLAIHNARSSWLTRQFALEYSALFAGLLPALARFRLPVPLGGTSNHFRRSFLDAAGGWDAYNVTEDADLGIRIARCGGQIATIPSVTWEEAPRRLRPWIGQRTRWLKGWMQTYLVHMRHPAELWRELGTASFMAFQALMGGVLLSSLLHPVFYVWMAWELWSGEFLSASAAPLEQGILLLACFNLVAGFISAMATAAITSGRMRGSFLLPHVLLMPIYWLLVSWAAWRAMIQLGTAPHFWEKTEHKARRRRKPAR